jgi:hypothetical protein
MRRLGLAEAPFVEIGVVEKRIRIRHEHRGTLGRVVEVADESGLRVERLVGSGLGLRGRLVPGRPGLLEDLAMTIRGTSRTESSPLSSRDARST